MKRIRSEKLTRVRPAGYATIELFALPEAPGHVVHVSTSRDGLQWKESVLTPTPLPLEQATLAFEQALAAQIAQGFAIEGSVPVAAPPAHPVQNPADASTLASLQPDAWRLLAPMRQGRAVWRIGERRLAVAVPRLVELIESGEPLLDYSIAWAIGRCGDGGAFEAMRELSRRARTPTVARAARWAALALWPQDQRAAEAARIVDDWPAALRRLWTNAQDLPVSQALQPLRDALADSAQWETLKSPDWIAQLLELALLEGDASAAPGLARAALFDFAHTLPLTAGSFRAWRRLYKGAEFAGDYRLLGVLHQRLETERANFNGFSTWAVVGGGRYVQISKEIVRDDSRLAFSLRTREYLRRRTWRSLRRLALAGAADEPDWLRMATGLLLAANDGEASHPHAAREAPPLYKPLYSHWLVLMQLLHRHDDEWACWRGGRRWHRATPVPERRTQRAEAWPERWDRHPQALLQLMQQARCAAVHAFAARALQDNKSFCDALDDDSVRDLDRKSTRLNSSHFQVSRMPSSA